MKKVIEKFILLSGIIIMSIQPVFCIENAGNVSDRSGMDYTLKSGISIIENIPNRFFGSWRVFAKLEEASSSENFKESTVDIWNLSRNGDVITLCNPFTGAAASITVNYVDNNIIKFSKTGDYDNKKLTDTVELKLEGDKFTGINRLTLVTFSDVDNSVIKKQTAVYILNGEKISGESVLKK